MYTHQENVITIMLLMCYGTLAATSFGLAARSAICEFKKIWKKRG